MDRDLCFLHPNVAKPKLTLTAISLRTALPRVTSRLKRLRANMLKRTCAYGETAKRLPLGFTVGDHSAVVLEWECHARLFADLRYLSRHEVAIVGAGACDVVPGLDQVWGR